MDHILLDEFKAALTEEKNRLTNELAAIARRNPSVKDDWTAEFPHFEEAEDVQDTDLEESADEVEEYEVRRATADDLEMRLRDVNAALERIEKGTYGISIKTGKPLSVERLRANPAAAFAPEEERMPEK